MSTKITRGEARTILDSRDKPTIEVELWSGAHHAVASVPSGKSTGSKEALEKRDPDGSVDSVVALLRSEVFPQVVARDFADQADLDTFLVHLDGTYDKSRLGANGILAVSIAFVKLSALVRGVPLWQHIAETSRFTPAYPRLYMNMLNGGAHADFRLPFQEYLIVVGGTPTDAYEHANRIFATLGDMVRAEVGEVPMGDEGGYAPIFQTIERPFELLRDLVRGEDDCLLAIDAAATELAIDDDDGYMLLGKRYTHAGLIELYKDLVARFPLRSIEDPFAEDDMGCFVALGELLPKDVLVVGDDLTVTNPHILKEMIALRAANALIIKPNQIGTLSEVYDTVRLAHAAGWKTIVSHRSGETADSFIADLAVGVGAYGLKAGAPSQAVRAAKYERLLVIETERKRLTSRDK